MYQCGYCHGTLHIRVHALSSTECLDDALIRSFNNDDVYVLTISVGMHMFTTIHTWLSPSVSHYVLQLAVSPIATPWQQPAQPMY